MMRFEMKLFNLRSIRDKGGNLLGERILLPPTFNGRALIDDINHVVWVKRSGGEIEWLDYDAINYFILLSPADSALFHQRIGVERSQGTCQ
jgi:hypothetical protein